MSEREADVVDVEVRHFTVSFALVECNVLQQNSIDLIVLQAANADQAARLVESQVNLTLQLLLIDLERSQLTEKADAVTAQQAAAVRGGLQCY